MANNDSGNGIVSFLLGGIAGLAAGLLLAPRKGEETRAYLADWLEENTEKARQFIEEHCECGCGDEERVTADSAGREVKEGAAEPSDDDA